MPRIELITPVKYQSSWPYQVNYDNLPLDYILARQDLINSAVDLQSEILNNAAGSAGDVANRLNQSLGADGSLSSTAIDEALHNIGAHADGEYDGVSYVRMTAEERSKLALMADEATSLSIQFDTISTISTASTTALFESGVLEVINSDTISWFLISPNKVEANLNFDPSAFHQHYYNLIPVAANLSSPDYTNYKVNSVSTPYIDGSLKVFINGIRLNETTDVYVYNESSGPSGTWYATHYTSSYEDGTFALSRAIDSTDVITIDFDISLT